MKDLTMEEWDLTPKKIIYTSSTWDFIIKNLDLIIKNKDLRINFDG